MTKPRFPMPDGKRYYCFYQYLHNRYQAKVCKIPLSGGFTCPNRDGTKGVGGCAFCSASGSGDFVKGAGEPIKTQMLWGKQMMRKKWKNALFLPYFQAFSATYAPLEKLRVLYETALEDPQAVGLCIATRPDCLPQDVCAYLSELNETTDLYLELGLQTIHDHTAQKLGRGHNFAEFLTGYRKLQSRGIRVCIHIINGLPGETREDMIDTIKEVARLHPFAVKIHLLHIIDGTPLADWYRNGLVSPMKREDYIRLVCDQLELLPGDIVIERLTGDGARSTLLAPEWSLKKFTILNDIDRELARRNSFQGMRACD